jgi:hypothetical protein
MNTFHSADEKGANLAWLLVLVVSLLVAAATAKPVSPKGVSTQFSASSPSQTIQVHAR